MNMNYIKKNPLSKVDFSSLKGLASIGAMAFLCLFGYRLYKKYFNDPVADAKAKAEKEVSAEFVTNQQSQASQLKETEKSLSVKGLTVGGLHRGLANQLHSLIDSYSVDEAKIISIVKEIKEPATIRLVKVAYGMRELKTWGILNPLQLLTPTGLGAIIGFNDLIGDLPSHLRIVLNDSQLKQIQTQLKYMI